MKIFILVFALMIFPLPAHAYLDPASGSAIISAIIGVFVAFSLVVKSYWYKLKSLFTEKTEDLTHRDSKGG